MRGKRKQSATAAIGAKLERRDLHFEDFRKAFGNRLTNGAVMLSEAKRSEILRFAQNDIIRRLVAGAVKPGKHLSL